jgi:hypothetical protein
MKKVVIYFDELVDVEKTIDRLYSSFKKKSLAFSSRNYQKYAVRDGGTEYWVDDVLVGVETNSIGPYGTSDFWEEYSDDDGNFYGYGSTETPDVDVSMFVDGCYNLIVIRFGEDDDVDADIGKTQKYPRA